MTIDATKEQEVIEGRVINEAEEVEESEDVEATEAENSEPVDETTADESDQTNADEEDEEDGDVIVTIGDEEPEPSKTEPAPDWVKELRKAHRETQKENRELKAKLEAKEKPQQVELGAKPKLEDFDYDAEEYEKAITSWYDKKRKVDAQAAELEEQKKAEQQAWQQRLASYNDAKSRLKVKDFEDAEAQVLETFNETQQGIIVQGADNSALVVYALGKNSDRLKELAQINDPVKFAFAVAKLEKDLKVKNRKAPPPPEKVISGTAPKSGAVDSTLEQLREEAARTGDFTKVSAYKRKKRAAKG